MPLTPFHLGPSSWIGLVFFKILDFPTFLVASVIVDVEPFIILIFNFGYPLHRFFHTFLGGSIVAILISIILYILRSGIKEMMARFKLAQESSFKKILWTSFVGVYFHLILDAVHHKEIEPFFPLKGNLFFGFISVQQIYIFCSLSFLLGILFYLIRLNSIKRNKSAPPD